MIIEKVKSVYDDIKVNGIVGTASIYYTEIKYRILRKIPLSKIHGILHECRLKLREKKIEFIKKLREHKEKLHSDIDKIKEDIHKRDEDIKKDIHKENNTENINVYNKGGV